MWSDRPSARIRSRLVRRLLDLLPAPAPAARGSKTPLRSGGHAPDRLAPDPLAVVEALRRLPDAPEGLMWLDGGGGPHRIYARPLVTLTVKAGQATVAAHGAGGGCDTFEAGGFDLLEAAFEAWGGTGGVPGTPGTPGTPGGTLAGFLGYELAGDLEPLPPPQPDDLGDVPDLQLSLFDAGLLWDGRRWTLESTDAWHASRSPAQAPLTPLDAETLLQSASRHAPSGVPAGTLAAGPVLSHPNRGGFEAAVERLRGHIGEGDLYQANLCRRLETGLAPGTAWPLYRRLRDASPAVHGAFLDLGGDRALLSVSPELYLAVRGREVETRPIKGTRPRGANPREDRAFARELLASAKDQAELTMIVDVARNDLGRVCEPGSVEVPLHGELVSLPTVHHTVSTVRGRLRPEAGVVDLLRASFPPASITGAPKIRAMSILAGLEERRRGPAMGAFGWMSLTGDLELAVAIRTAVAVPGRAAYHAGCGIVADSDPELEYEESAVKAKAFLTALGAREPA